MKEIPNVYDEVDRKTDPDDLIPKERRVFIQTADKVHNPLMKFPPNIPCFCGSRIKAKKCCLPYAKPYVKPATRDQINALLKRIAAGEQLIIRFGDDNG